MIMKNKQGQATIFFMLATLVVFGAGIMMYLENKSTKEITRDLITEVSALSTASVRDFVEECMHKVGEEALFHVGQRGGYNTLPERSTDNEFFRTAYYVDKDTVLVPKQEIIEQEISTYIDENLPFCFDNFSAFAGQGEVLYNDPKTATMLAENEVAFTTLMPLTVVKEDTVQSLEKFSTQKDEFRMKTIYDAANDIARQQLGRPTTICLSCLTKIAEKHDVHVDMQRLSPTTVVFIITDTHSQIKGEHYTFMFAHEYFLLTCENPSLDAPAWVIENCLELELQQMKEPFEVGGIPSFTLASGELFEFTIPATGTGLSFKAHTSLFDINSAGAISFVPREMDRGKHAILLEIGDSSGNERFLVMELEVI